MTNGQRIGCGKTLPCKLDHDSGTLFMLIHLVRKYTGICNHITLMRTILFLLFSNLRHVKKFSLLQYRLHRNSATKLCHCACVSQPYYKYITSHKIDSQLYEISQCG